MKEFKDVTSTTFGLIIAYLIPGLAALYGLSFVSDRVDHWFTQIVAGESSAALFLLVVVVGILIGLQLSVLRTVIFENIICRDCGFKPELLKRISEEGRFAAYRMLIDEQLRYHQFWGAMSFV